MTVAAFSQQFYFYLVLISSTISLFLMVNLVYAGPTGLTLKLIHRDSPESPLFPGNLTQEERIQRDFERSKVRHQHLKAMIKSWRVRNSTSHPDDIAKPPVFFSPETHFYMALVGLGPTGLTLKLIHIDSPESPLYPGNLTQEERIHRDFQRSEAHFQKLTTLIKSSWQVRNYSSSSSSSSNSYPVLAERRPPVIFYGVHYLAQVGIGTFAQQTSKTYFLMVDTGSSISWLQCKGCDPCFPQVGGPYPATDSATYSKIPYKQQPPRHTLCRADLVDPDGFCKYQIKYVDKSYTSGVLATETLTVNVDSHGLERIPNFVFGCGLEQRDFKTGHGQAEVELAGILGLGGADYSFVKQLGVGGQMRFAYCFQLWSDTWASKSNTYLRFGSDADHIGGAVVQTTKFVHGRGDTLYYVTLNGISVGEAPVEFLPGSIVLGPKGIGGCVFDSGAPLTLMAPKLYDIFEAHLIQYFTALDIEKADRQDLRYKCFIKRNGFTNYPSITFHFKGADFEIEPEAAFYIDDVVFCSTIAWYNVAPDATFVPFDVVFGATQQANHRVLYDLDNLAISWTKEQCISPL